MNDWREAPDAIARFCADHGIARVHANAEWGLNERRRDEAVAAALGEADVEWTLHQGGTLLPPGSVLTGKGECYRVYTPYARACREAAQRAAGGGRRAPSADAAGLGRGPAAGPLRRLRPALGRGARALARRRGCRRRAAGRLCRRGHRVLPGRPRLPVATRHELPVALSGRRRAVGRPGARAAQAANLGELDSGKAGIATWINELLWREFYQHLLAAYPELSMHRPMKPETAHVPWRDAPDDLLAWQEGRTGIPIVDAAMRQLLALGWMHNRLRMVTAMFLSKNLLIDWRLGEAWFMAHLVDGDLAANNGGWQWSASTGADAVPYFRVFNPLSQSRKFDPDGVFLREWLPELAHLPGDAIHDPSPMERAAAGYPAPIVDLAGSRLRALEAFGNLPRA